MSNFQIKNRLIGDGHPAYIIAEMSANHAGSLEHAKEILSQYGIVEEETITEIRRYVLEEPGNYLKYYMGYLLIMDLKEKAETLMGSSYTDMKFHEFILNSGPSNFENLEKRLLEMLFVS